MTQNAAPSPNSATNNAFDMKAGHFTLPALMIKGDDADQLDRFLAEQVAKSPQFFDQAPLVIDLSQFPAGQSFDSFPLVVGLIRGHGMIPVGVRGASAEQVEQAQMLELAIMPRHRGARDNESVQNKPNVAPVTLRDAMVVNKPVRSGQRVYADGSDLILLGGVSSGAEVMADGNVHAYAPIRGRVLAGVRENHRARIFCRNLGAELVAIAGRYRVAEDLPRQFLGRSVQISLLENSLQFASL